MISAVCHHRIVYLVEPVGWSYFVVMRRKHFTLAITGFVVLSSAALLAAAPQAQAQQDLLVCNGISNVGFDPPLTNTATPTTVSISESFSPCLDLSNLTVISGETSFSVNRTTSCTSLTDAPAVATYHWNNGQSSTVDFTSNVTTRLADGTTDVTSVGTVTSGLGNGATATREVIMPQLDLAACADSGVSQESGTEILTFE